MPKFTKDEFTALLANNQVIRDGKGGIWKPLERLDARSPVPCLVMKNPAGQEIRVFCEDGQDGRGFFTMNLTDLPELNHPDTSIIPA